MIKPEKIYNKKHIGETFMTNERYYCEIVDGSTKRGYCTIRIRSYITEALIGNVKKGKIKYPYYPSLYGIGYLGVGKYKAYMNSKPTKEYKLWTSMLQRCYDKKYQERQPTYIGTTVDKAWHNFQVFADWFKKSNYQEDWQLDKDLLSSKNIKIYSPDTCIFLPQTLNNFLTDIRSNNVSGYTGVSLDKRKNKWRVCISDGKASRIHLGYFNSKTEASNIYKAARVEKALEWQAKMKNILPTQAINNIK